MQAVANGCFDPKLFDAARRSNVSFQVTLVLSTLRGEAIAVSYF